MAKQNHTHKFKLHRFKNGTKVFFCVDNCDYRIPWELALGKMSICHRCNAPFQMNQYSMRLTKPHCDKCHIFKDPDKPKRQKKETTPQKQVVESLMRETASRIENDLSSRLEQAVKSPIRMLTEDELL